MRVTRFCGKERLPGTTRRWARLALVAGFTGQLEVYGYGTVGEPGREHRRSQRTGEEGGVILADFEPGTIRVWLPCACAAAEFDQDDLIRDNDHPLASFAHELGHHRQHTRGKGRHGPHAEAAAERYGRMLLKRVS